jgi:hypothetical protein
VQRSFFSKRNFAVAAETPSVFDFFDVEADLDTDAAQHLRRRSGANQEQSVSVECCQIATQISIVVLSEAKDLLSRAATKKQILRFAQDDNPPKK